MGFQGRARGERRNEACVAKRPGEFQEVPIIRFREGLAAGKIGSGTAIDFADANRQQQRTLLVVNSSTLKQLELSEQGKRSLWNAYERLERLTVA